MHISRYLLLSFLLFMITVCLPQPSWARFTVVIDPGHGGKDPGTLHRKGKLDEKTIALNVAQKLGALIEANHKDVKVVYTRKGDTYPSLQDRTETAKKSKGDLFISIHVNACPSESIFGFETYVFGSEGSASGTERAQSRMVEERENLDFLTGKQINFDTDIDIETKILCQAQREKHNKQSLEAANFVQKSMCKSVRSSGYGVNTKNRGVIAKNLFVLCYVPMPAILIEMGYITNRTEERFLNTDEGQTALAQGVYNGFCQYKKNWDKRQLSASDNVIAEVIPTTTSQQETKAGNQVPVENKAKAETKTDKPTDPNSISEIEGTGTTSFRIQFISSDKLVKINDRSFKGLKPVSYYKEGKYYKYTYGVGNSTTELKSDFQKVRKLFPDAFIVKFDANGKRIK